MERTNTPKTRDSEHEPESESEASSHELGIAAALTRSDPSGAGGHVARFDAETAGAAAEHGAQPRDASVSEHALGPDAAGEAPFTSGSPTSILHELEKVVSYQGRSLKRRAAALARGVQRQRGADWTAAELGQLLASHGAEAVFPALDQREARQGIDVLHEAGQWDALVAALPAGKLAAATCEALAHLVGDGCLSLAETIALFPQRFGHKAADVSSSWTLHNMQVMWRALEDLPAQDVTLNSAITTFQAVSGGGGAYSGAIDIGQRTRFFTGGGQQFLENTVRHEIGHAVHAQLRSEVDPWLKNDMGFYPLDSFREWVEAAGGFPDTFVDENGQRVIVDDNWKRELANLVYRFTGHGSWSPARTTPSDDEPPVVRAAWSAMPATVKNACKQSKSNWYTNYEDFQVVNGNRLFVNHWYHQPYVMGPAAFAVIPATGDRYAAMSEKEFFATCYAQYFEDPAGVTDPDRWGGRLPAHVVRFFREVIVKRNPYTAFQEREKNT